MGRGQRMRTGLTAASAGETDLTPQGASDALSAAGYSSQAELRQYERETLAAAKRAGM